MPRNGAGIYTLPPSNPVVPFTTIATAWANPTLSDIADALTDSLSRTGLGGMLSPFRIADGTLPSPGMAFTNETGLGIRRPSAGIMSFVNSGSDVFQILSDRASSPTRLDHRGIDTFRSTGSASWRVMNSSGGLLFTPSASIDGDDWAVASSWGALPNGNIEVGKDLHVIGTLTAGDWDINAPDITGPVGVNGDIICNGEINAPLITANQFSLFHYVSAGDSAVNFALGQTQFFNLAAPLTITSIAGLTAGNIGRIAFYNTNHAVTWPANVRWPGPTYVQPDLAAGPSNFAIVVLEFDSANYFANASVY